MLTIILSLVLRQKLGGGLKSLTLFQLDSVLAVLSASTSLSVGHAEDVVCLDSAVNTTVPWNGLSELGSFIARNLNTVENTEGIFI